MRTLLQNIQYEGRLRAGYIAAFFLLLISFLLTYYTNQKLMNNANRVDHTNKIITGLEAMLSQVKDGETGSRGYVATNNINFLDPYFGSGRGADSVCRVLKELVKDNQEQTQLLNNISNNVKLRFAFIDNNIKSFNSNNGVLTPLLLDSFKMGKEVMDLVRMDVNKMQKEEGKLLERRNQEVITTSDALNSIVIASIIIAFFLVVFGFSSHIKENKERMLAEKKVRDYQDELNNQINKLAAANKELIQMRSIEKFAATGRIARTIAHEIRNPLTNINLATDQLSSEMPAGENTTFLFEMINRNSNRINLLISDLLNSTKFSELNYEKVSINNLLNEALEQANDRILLNNIILIKKYSNDICDISVDKEKIKIAFLNIIINALEAMEGKENATLTIETKKEKNQCVIIFNDTGSGLDEDSVSKLFEPYFTNKPNGNGLGLTNTQNIILNHKGNISVRSKAGEGTSFIVLLDIV